jgi:hypothetical protein
MNEKLRVQGCTGSLDAALTRTRKFMKIFPFDETYVPEPDAMMTGVCKTAKS